LLRPVPDIEAQEIAWWQTFGEVENRFCWVQPRSVQRILRGHYVKRIARSTSETSHVLELGCGTGWLCRLLAQAGARRVIGLDFSAAQIEIARRETRDAGLHDRVDYVCTSTAEYASRAKERFDTLIMHGFLHHLSVAELEEVLNASANLVRPGGQILLFEPFRRTPQASAGPLFWRSIGYQQRLLHAARPENPARKLPCSVAEKSWRDIINRRSQAIPPRGPSPKELPIRADELTTLLPAGWIRESTFPCMLLSHLVVQEWLLRAESLPLPDHAAVNYVARLASFLDRIACREKNIPENYWAFDLWVLKRRR